MSASNAVITPTNISLSPMRVKFNGVDLGGTTSNVSINIKYDMADIMVDQFGKSVIDKKVSGLVYSIKFDIAETKNLDNWKVAFSSMKEVVNAGVKSMYADMQIGDSLLAHSHLLLLHPLENVDADLTGDFTFFKAACIQASEAKYGPEKQTVLNVEFVVFPDTSVIPAKYMILGDPANGLIAASAGSATPGSNTGNGTIGTIVAYSGHTATENITITCVGQTSGNNFYVSGSFSGPLGEFHIAAAASSTANFVAGQISFTATQGSVQFVTNDSFVIATVAANYS